MLAWRLRTTSAATFHELRRETYPTGPSLGRTICARAPARKQQLRDCRRQAPIDAAERDRGPRLRPAVGAVWCRRRCRTTCLNEFLFHGLFGR